MCKFDRGEGESGSFSLLAGRNCVMLDLVVVVATVVSFVLFIGFTVGCDRL